MTPYSFTKITDAEKNRRSNVLPSFAVESWTQVLYLLLKFLDVLCSLLCKE